MSVYTTTFGIDVSKKCFCNSGAVPKGVTASGLTIAQAWAYGTLSEDCLKNISMTYEEKFGEAYASQVRDAYEGIISGVVKTIKKSVKIVQALANGEAVTSAISESGGTGSDKQSLQSLLLEYGTAVAAAQESCGMNGDDSLNALVNSAVSIPAYNIPTRKEIPGLSIGFGNSIKLNFQFGSAGVFNAKKEVYDPIKIIMSSFQKFSVSQNSITATSDGIPWEAGGLVAKAETLGLMFNGTVEPTLSSMSTIVKDLAKSTTKFGKAATKVIEAKMGLQKLYEDAESNKSADYVDKKYLENNDDAWLTIPIPFGDDIRLGGTSHISPDYANSLASAHFTEANNSIVWNESYANYLRSGAKNTFNDLVNKGKKGQEELRNAGVNSIWDSLAKLAKAEPNAVKAVIEQRIGEINQMSLFLGCYNVKGQNIYYSITDIINDVDYSPKQNDANKPIKHAVCLCGIPEKVEAGLDYSNVDQDGYPKAGWIAIKKMHIVQPYSTFANTFAHPVS